MLVNLRRLYQAGVVLGIGMRLLSILNAWPGFDGSYYAAMGNEFGRGNGFLLPYGSVFQGNDFVPVVAQHQAPLWPAILAAAYRLAGFSLATTSATSLLTSLALLLVTFLLTRDLLGQEKAWFVSAVLGLDYFLIETTARAYSENLVTILYVATIWAILRSLSDNRYIVLAGIMAGAGYLAKSSVGYFFILAGVLGFLWRFYYMGWVVLKNRYYMLAIAAFMSLVGLWAMRNIVDFGWPHWETSPYTNAAIAYSLGNPIAFLPVLSVKLVEFGLFVGAVGVFFVPQLFRQARNWRQEWVSGLALAIMIPFVLGVLFATCFQLYEGWRTWLWEDNVRYIDLVFVPLLWLALRFEPLPLGFVLSRTSLRPAALRWRRLRSRTTAARFLAVLSGGIAFFGVSHMLGVVLVAGGVVAPFFGRLRVRSIVCLLLMFALASVNAATIVYHPSDYLAGEFLARSVKNGVTVAIDGDINAYYLYPALTGKDIRLVRWNGSPVAFIVSRMSHDYSGYRLLASFNWTEEPGLLDSMYWSLAAELRRIANVPRLVTEVQDDAFVYQALSSP